MTISLARIFLVVAGTLFAVNAVADGPADKVTGSFRHAAPVNDPGDVVYSKIISAHEALDGMPQFGFIYVVRPDGTTWEFIDLGDAENACVNVYTDGEARVGGLVTDGTGPGLGRYFGWALQDNGEPGRMSDLTTTLRFDNAENFLAWCEDGSTDWANAVWPHIVVGGNLQVHNFSSDAD